MATTNPLKEYWRNQQRKVTDRSAVTDTSKLFAMPEEKNKIEEDNTGASFYVVSMGYEGKGPATNIEKWSEGKIKHIQVPTNSSSPIDSIVKQISENDKSKLGIGLLMIIGVHGVLHNLYSDTEERYHETYAYTSSGYNKILSTEWIKLSTLRFMPNAIFFCTACNIATNYPLLKTKEETLETKKETSAIKIISQQFNGKAIGAHGQCSAELPPKDKAYRYNPEIDWQVAINGNYVPPLNIGVNVVSKLSNGGTRELKKVITTQQIIDMAIEAENQQK